MGRLPQQPCQPKVRHSYGVNAPLKIAFINARSLHQHKTNVEHDFNLSTADFLFCSGIRFQEGDAKCFNQGLWLADLNAYVIGQSIDRRGVA